MLRRAPSLLIVVAIAACKREPEAGSSAAAPRDRKTRCEAIGEETTRMGMAMAKGLAAGLSDGKAKLDDADEAQLARELETAKAELVEQCMTWPEEALDCFGLGAALQGDKCERIMATAMGDPVLPEDVPPGPQPAWRIELPHELVLLHGRPDGSVVAIVEPETRSDDGPRAYAIAVASGKESWRHELSFEPFAVEPLGADAVLVVGDYEIVALAAADGKPRWTTKSPESTESYGGPIELVAYADDGKRVVLLGADERLFQLRPERCAAGACLEAIATLELEDTYATRWLEPGPADGWIVVEGEGGRADVFDGSGKRTATILAHTSVAWAERDGSSLRVGLDGAVAQLDLAACGSAPFAPIPWPPGGKAKWVKDATVRELEAAAPPAGCVRWSTALDLVEGSDRVGTPADPMVVQSGGFLVALGTDGTQGFKTPVNAMSATVSTTNGWAVVGDDGLDEVSLVLSWIDRTGKHQRRSALPLAEGRSFMMSDVDLVAAGSTIVAGTELRLVAFAE